MRESENISLVGFFEKAPNKPFEQTVKPFQWWRIVFFIGGELRERPIWPTLRRLCRLSLSLSLSLSLQILTAVHQQGIAWFMLANTKLATEHTHSCGSCYFKNFLIILCVCLLKRFCTLIFAAYNGALFERSNSIDSVPVRNLRTAVLSTII